MLLNIVRYILRFLFAVLTRTQACGLENIPVEGGAILAANHLSRLDAPLVFIHIERQDLTGLVADTYQKKPFFRWLINTAHGIWINRQEADLQALREARQYLQAGGLLGIAPEGTRSRTGALIPAKTGVAYLADKASVPIVPIAIYGSEIAVRDMLRLRRPRITIHFGHPFLLPPLQRGDRSASLQRNTDEIMCRIAAMLPPQYHGVYANHPRLGEFSGAPAPRPKSQPLTEAA
jgi:1-acyl-sn-glycerol-3-phosphate acyltransferase